MAYNNNDIIVIPDIHGRQFWRRAVELYPDADTIFLGDYHDPYPAEGITNEESLANLRELFDYVKSHDNVHLLMGNHDLNYFADFGKKVRYDEKKYPDNQVITDRNIAKNYYRNDTHSQWQDRFLQPQSGIG